MDEIENYDIGFKERILIFYIMVKAAAWMIWVALVLIFVVAGMMFIFSIVFLFLVVTFPVSVPALLIYWYYYIQKEGENT